LRGKCVAMAWNQLSMAGVERIMLQAAQAGHRASCSASHMTLPAATGVDMVHNAHDPACRGTALRPDDPTNRRRYTP